MYTNAVSIGELIREWRQRRRLSQLELALEAEISTRHLSFLETGRAAPSREMVLRLAEHLAVPLRERNALLIAAGFAPAYSETPMENLADHPAMAGVRALLARHEPFPALVIDRSWRLIEANSGIAPLLQGVSAALLEPPVNVLRLSLHPEGLAPRIRNLRQWRDHLLHRLRRQFAESADAETRRLLDELASYPAPPPAGERERFDDVAVPLRIATPAGVLSFLSTTMVFGTPLAVTLSEIALETFLPADAETARALGVAAQSPPGAEARSHEPLA